MISILTLTELKALVEISEREDAVWTRWINQATNDIDNLCAGLVFATYASVTDEGRINKLKYAIANTVEGYDQNARIFGKSGTTTGGGDAPFNLSTQSDNSSIEFKRQDIIKSLVTGGWYKNLSMDSQIDLNTTISNEELAQLVETLGQFFLRTDGTNEFLGEDFNLANGGDIINGGNISAVNDGFTKTISGYNFNFNPDTVVDKANKIYDPIDAQYKYIDKIQDIAFFGEALTKAVSRQEIYLLLQAISVLWNKDIAYAVDTVVSYLYDLGGKQFLGQAVSLISFNKGNDPFDSPAEWLRVESQIIDVTYIVAEVIKAINLTLPTEITTEVEKQLEALPTLTYKSEGAGELIEFENEADFETYKTIFGIDDTYFTEVIEENVDISSAQTITGSKTFNADQTIAGENQLNIGDARQWIRYNGIGIECVSLDNKNWDFFVSGTKKVSFTNTGIDLFNNTISNLAAPTTDLQATNKKYVDDAVAAGGGGSEVWENVPYTIAAGGKGLAFNPANAYSKLRFKGEWNDPTGQIKFFAPFIFELYYSRILVVISNDYGQPSGTGLITENAMNIDTSTFATTMSAFVIQGVRK